MSRAAENHNAFVRQLEGIFEADGGNNPLLAAAFNRMIFVSWCASWAAPPTTDASTKGDGNGA